MGSNSAGTHGLHNMAGRPASELHIARSPARGRCCDQSVARRRLRPNIEAPASPLLHERQATRLRIRRESAGVRMPVVSVAGRSSSRAQTLRHRREIAPTSLTTTRNRAIIKQRYTIYHRPTTSPARRLPPDRKQNRRHSSSAKERPVARSQYFS